MSIIEKILAKILLVDDKQGNLDALEALLDSTKFEIHKATSGEMALKYLLDHEYACCLLDVRMPVMDGFVLADIIHNDPIRQFTPIIFVTAEAGDKESIYKAYEKGAVDFVTKPIDPKILRSKVDIFVELYKYRKALERTEEIKRLNEKLQSANSDLSHFTTMAAHDMHEPVRRMKNFLDLLEYELGDISTISKELLNKVNSAIDYLYGMINDFRALTGVDYQDIVRTETNLKILVQECVDWHRGELEKRQVQIKLDEFPQSYSVYTSLVKRLYENLIQNVLHHVKTDGFSLHFTAKLENSKWIFGVKNSNSEILPENINKIFLMYRKLENHNKERTGVGLSICKKITERHKGKIWAESNNNHVHILFTLED